MSLTKRERGFVDRIDGIVREAGLMTPKNPADVAAIVANHRKIVAACKATHEAIGAWRTQDLDSVEEHLTDAERQVAR